MNYLEQLFSVKDKVAVITGGNGQLGTEYAKTLLQAGAKVAIFDVCRELNGELSALQRENKLVLFSTDITKKAEVAKQVEAVETLWGTPDILINNAALDSPPGANPAENRSFEEYSLESWQRVLDVNLTGVFLCCQVIGAKMAAKKRGSIINISSIYGILSPNQNIYSYRAARGTAFVKPISYSATKSAILNLTRYLATYWGKDNVRVNTLVLGGVFNNQDSEFIKNYTNLSPIGRMAGKDEYNGAVLFLSSEASSYVTGTSIVLDGGWSAW